MRAVLGRFCVSDGGNAMPEVMEGSHMAEILLVGALRRLKFNAGDW